jgi:hypothetical protein
MLIFVTKDLYIDIYYFYYRLSEYKYLKEKVMKDTKILCHTLIVFLVISSLIFPAFQAAIQDKVDVVFPIASTVNAAPYEYYTYDNMTALLMNLSQTYPDIMSLNSIAKTYEGRDVWVVKLSDNVLIEEEEPGVLFMGAHHGDEKPSFEVLIYFIKYVVETYQMEETDNDGDGLVNEDHFDGIDNDGDGEIDEDPDEVSVRNVLSNTELYIIPMVNPDGVEYDWRKNREPNYGADGQSTSITSYGVDLNRNYGYMWNIVYLFPENYFLDYILDDQSWVYRGEEPFSEKETQAVKAFVEAHEISISLSYHDYGEFMIFPWMHTSRNTPHESLFRSIGENMSQINKYELKIYGQYGEREYLIPRYQGTPGSSENWLYGSQGIISFTMELCRRRPERISSLVLDACWKHVGVNLYVCERAQTIDEEKQTISNGITKDIQFPYLSDNILALH